MKTSESQKSLVAALIHAQGQFPTIAKSKEGQSGNRRFKYAPLDEVLNAVRPVLLSHGLLLTQGTEGDELVTRLDHVSGEWREHRMPINAEHANMQSYGIELTYRRRYAVQPMLGIVTEEDTDGAGSGRRMKGKDHTEPRNDNGTLQGSGIISGPAEVFNSLQPEVQDHLRRNVARVDGALPDVEKAKSIVEEIMDDWPDDIRNEVKTGLWFLMDRKTKAAIRASK